MAVNILLIGGGAREHALAYRIKQSPLCGTLHVAPGNPGIAELGVCHPSLNAMDADAVAQFVHDNSVGLVVVGPEAYLMDNLAGLLPADERCKGIPVVGPVASGAMLEGSKEFAKQFMARHNIPTAAYLSVTKENLQSGREFLRAQCPPYVLKADGLAAGKGVLILNDLKDAEDKLEDMLGGMFGQASAKVVLEQYLSGIEMSAFVLTDGKDYVVLPEAKDYKRVGEGDTGLNTGGMGAVSPVPFATPDFLRKVEERIIKPTVDGLLQDGIPYKGFIFFGLMNVGGDPYVIEYNVRMGDPETEVVMPRIKSDFVELLLAAGRGELAGKSIEIDPCVCTTVMMVAGGYPEQYHKGDAIEGLDRVSGSIVFHAGTKRDDVGNIVTNGGRVLTVTSTGNSRKEALATSYANVAKITFKNSYFRRDIGKDLDAYAKA